MPTFHERVTARMEGTPGVPLDRRTIRAERHGWLVMQSWWSWIEALPVAEQGPIRDAWMSYGRWLADQEKMIADIEYAVLDEMRAEYTSSNSRAIKTEEDEDGPSIKTEEEDEGPSVKTEEEDEEALSLSSLPSTKL